MGKISNLATAVNTLIHAFRELGMAEPAALVLKDEEQFQILSSIAFADVVLAFRGATERPPPSICGIPLRVEEPQGQNSPSKMLEHVAYEIAKAEEPNMGLSWCMNPDNRERCRKLARVAVTAMREPTKAMILAAEQQRDIGGDAGPGDLDPTLAWQAMIDAALKD